MGLGSGAAFRVLGDGLGGVPEVRDDENKDKSFLHVWQRATPMAFHVSQCPQTMPISVRKVSSVAFRAASLYTNQRPS